MADGPRDALVQAPTFKQPERGSLAGSLASLSFGASDVSRGAYSMPLPVQLPSERGGPLAHIIPSYAPEAGLSEWGIGWSTNLAIQRFRLRGDVDYQTDEFTSPWGRLVRGTDGLYYPSGLAAPVRLRLRGDSWQAIGPDGTRYEFDRAQETPEGTYAWYLTHVETIFGDRTTIEYEANASGRQFVEEMYYGGREDPRAYRAELQYERLAVPLTDYRSGHRVELDRRVTGVVAHVKHGAHGSYRERWRYTVDHADAAFGPGFYLDSVVRTFASGESEPPVAYDYDLPEVETSAGLVFAAGDFEEAPSLTDYLDATFDVDGVQPDHAATTDVDEDGVADLEHAWDFALYRQSPDGGWRMEPLPPRAGNADPLCRPGESLYNGPRTLVRMQGVGGPVQVLVLDAFWSQTEVRVCDRAGILQHSVVVEGSWVLGANTKIVDLNRDDRPDLLWVDSGGYQVLENVSDAGCTPGAGTFCPPLGFRALPPGTLTFEHGTPFDPSATWAQDINGDGNPDLVLRTADRISIWYGRGRFMFDEHEHSFPFRNLRGDELENLDEWEVSWLDANKDGLADAVLALHSEATLFINEGDRFQEVAVPSFIEAQRLGWAAGAPVVGDLRGRGETEVVFPSLDGAFAVALTKASTGLLTRIDDGKGSVVSFGYDRAAATPGLRQRPAVLDSMTLASAGYDPVTYDYRYLAPVLHRVGHFLVGFGRTERVGAVISEGVTFHHDDDVAALVTSARTLDSRTPHVVRLSTTEHEAAWLAGVRFLRPKKTAQGWCAEDDVGRCLRGAAMAVIDTAEIQEYGREVCATKSLSTTVHGRLQHVTQLAAPSGLGDALHCLSAGETWTGLHDDRSLDFVLATSIGRNSRGQTELIRQLGDENLTIQEAGYDPLTHRLAWLRSPGSGTQTFTFDPSSGLMKQTVGADGVLTSVTDRDTLTDAIRELTSDRGEGGQLASSFRFDGMERLARSWASFGGSSEAMPLETVLYQYPDSEHPGLMQIANLIDARRGSYKRTAMWQYPDGVAMATAVRHPDGWVVSGLATQDRNDLRSDAYWREPLGAATDLASQTYNDLKAGGHTLLGTSRSAGFGHLVASTSVVQSGVVRQTSDALEIGRGELITSTTENATIQTRSAVDGGGRLLWAEDQVGVATRYSYDALGRLTGVTLGDGTQHRLTYDGVGRPSRIVRDGIGTVAYVYAPVIGRLDRKEFYDADGVLQRTLALGYDDVGRVVEDAHTLAATGEVRRYRYHFDGRVPDGDAIAGQQGYLTTVETDDYVNTVVRNPDGSAAFQSITLGGWMQLDIAETYYASGALAQTQRTVTRLRDGTVVDDVEMAYEYDTFGRLDVVKLRGQPLAMFHYDREGRLDSLTLVGGGSISYSFDPATHRATGYHRRSGGEQDGWENFASWSRNARGLVEYENLGAGGRSWRRDYTYDDRGFLTRSEDVDAVASYSYGSTGLPQTVDDQLGSRTVARGSARTLVAGAISYRYDAFGRVVARGDVTFGYGPDGQLAIATTGGGTIRYSYDESGNRILKRRDGVPVAGYVAGGYLTDDSFVAPIRLGGQLIGVVERGQFRMLATDPRGSVMADRDGTPRPLSPFGARTASPDIAEALDYVEKGLDRDLGVVRMGVRDYDPLLSQFLAPDPLFLENVDRCARAPVECNLYAYAVNNPISFADPSGTEAKESRFVELNAEDWEDGAFVKTYRIDESTWKEFGPIVRDARPGWDYVGSWIVRTEDGGSGGYRHFYKPVVDERNAVNNWLAENDWNSSDIEGLLLVLDYATGVYGAFRAGLKNVADDAAEQLAQARTVVDDVAEGLCRVACFTAEVGVQTDDGLKPISLVRVGDRVLSSPQDDPTSRPVLSRVSRTMVRDVSVVMDVVVFRPETGVPSVITGTPEHPVYVEDVRSFNPLRDLLPGQRLRTPDGGALHVVMTVARDVGTVRVYNLEVAKTHTYFVAPLASPDQLFLVHNTCCDEALQAVGGGRITDPSRLLPERAGPTGHISPSEVAGRTPAQIDARARELGLTPRGPDPAGGRGAYIDPQTGQQRILSHPNVTPPHGHVNNPAGQRIDINSNVVPSESPAAHLPLGGG